MQSDQPLDDKTTNRSVLAVIAKKLGIMQLLFQICKKKGIFILSSEILKLILIPGLTTYPIPQASRTYINQTSTKLQREIPTILLHTWRTIQVTLLQKNTFKMTNDAK